MKEKNTHSAKECLKAIKSKSTTWVNIKGIHDKKFMDEFAEGLQIHSLVLEDILTPNQRPKLEEYENFLFIVLKILYLDGKKLISSQFSMIVTDHSVVSFQEGDSDFFHIVKERLKSPKSNLRNHGADYLTYVLIDKVVDNYFSVIENFEEQVEGIEHRLLEKNEIKILKDIYAVKSKLSEIRKQIWPLREILDKMGRLDITRITKNTKLYLRDVYDHTIQIIETTESLNERSSNLIDVHLSNTSNKMNEVMKVLTVISTIFIPLTFITGIYGMNFKYMPEIGAKYSYPVVTGIMLLIAIIMLIYFKKKKWV